MFAAVQFAAEFETEFTSVRLVNRTRGKLSKVYYYPCVDYLSFMDL